MSTPHDPSPSDQEQQPDGTQQWAAPWSTPADGPDQPSSDEPATGGQPSAPPYGDQGPGTGAPAGRTAVRLARPGLQPAG